MIRVLHVVTYMGRGGLETMLMNYYRAIDRTKVQFDFLTHRDFRADYDDEIEAMGGIIYHLPRLNPFGAGYRRALNSFFDSHPEYRIVHVHQDCLSGVVLKAAKEHGVPHRIAHSHSSSQTKDLKYPLKLLFRPMIVPNSTALFACGKEAGKWMFRTDDFRVLNNAIDAKKYSFSAQTRKEIRESLGIGQEELVIGHVGRFSPPKNHDFLLDVFASIRRRIDAKLLLVGDGALRPDAENKARELGLVNDVIFTGVRTDVEDVLQAMDVFVFPSIYEGLPVTVVEAQAAGLPCVISDKVPMECRKTDLVHQISLDAGCEYWADFVLALADYPRRDMYEEIKNAGFDIKCNAENLAEYYLGLQ